MKVSQSDFESRITEVTPKEANLSSAARLGKARLEFANKYRDELEKFCNKVLWTVETKINFYQSDGKAKVGRKGGSADDPKHTLSSFKHGGGHDLGLLGCFWSWLTRLF